jgi:hypothetical protein
VAKINTVIPEGAEIRGPGWIPPDAAKVRVLPTDSATLHIWADPGTYTLRYKIMWVSFRARTFKDGDGNEITINEYIGSDYVEESAEFRVLGTVDPPDPPDPPDPNINGPYEIMMFWNKNTGHSLQQAAVLRGQELRDQLRARGHIFLEVIEAGQMAGAPPEFKPFVDAAQGRAMPLVVISRERWDEADRGNSSRNPRGVSQAGRESELAKGRNVNKSYVTSGQSYRVFDTDNPSDVDALKFQSPTYGFNEVHQRDWERDPYDSAYHLQRWGIPSYEQLDVGVRFELIDRADWADAIEYSHAQESPAGLQHLQVATSRYEVQPERDWLLLGLERHGRSDDVPGEGRQRVETVGPGEYGLPGELAGSRELLVLLHRGCQGSGDLSSGER